MATINLLPTEVLLNIYGFLDMTDIRALRFVSKPTSAAAAGPIFNQAEFRVGQQAFQNVLVRPHLRVHVRKLKFDRLEPGVPPGAGNEEIHEAQNTELNELFEQMVGYGDVWIHSIRLSRNGFGGFCMVLRAAASNGILSIRYVIMSSSDGGDLISVPMDGGPIMDEQTARALGRVEKVRSDADFSLVDRAPPLLSYMTNLQTLVLDGKNSFPSNHVTWRLLLDRVSLSLPQLRKLTLMQQALYPCMLDSALIHQASVRHIAFLSVDLGPVAWFGKFQRSYGFVPKDKRPEWHCETWQKFIDTFAAKYPHGREKKLTLGNLTERRHLVSVRTGDIRAVKLLGRQETLGLLEQGRV
jgi:hypothetical protein